MHFRIFPMIAASALAAMTTCTQAAGIEVLHWWTTAGDSKAVKLLAEGVTEKGDKWLDTAIAGGPGPGFQITMSRMAAGDPPGAVQMPLGVRVKDVAAEKLLGDISDVSSKGKWADALPATVLRSVTFSGKVVAIPVTMHGVNWLWYSRKVLESAKVAPPKNWDEMMAAAEKIKAAGFIPFAVSSQSWQISWLYGNILAGVGGRIGAGLQAAERRAEWIALLDATKKGPDASDDAESGETPPNSHHAADGEAIEGSDEESIAPVEESQNGPPGAVLAVAGQIGG